VASNSMALTLVINPSLILRQSQPRSTNCQNVVVNTLEGKQWTFTVEAVGLRKATKDHPLTFYWGLRAKQWDIQLKHTSLYRKPLPKHGLIILEARGTGPISTLSGGSGSYLVKVGSDLVGKLQLQGLATGAISYSDSNLPVTVNAMAVDADGRKVTLAVDLTLRFPGEVSYAGKVKLVSRGEPKSITSCIPGPRETITYAYDKSPSKKRNLTIKYREVCKPETAVIPKPYWTCDLKSLKTNNILRAFGISGWTSPNPNPSLSGSVPKGHYGMFYQQLLEFDRLGLLTLWDQCGRSVVGADVTLTDWAFTAELATGPTCPPPSKLGPAKTF